MRILKVLLVFLAIYFIRRFVQMYRVMKAIQEQQASEKRSTVARPERTASPVINADFKVID